MIGVLAQTGQAVVNEQDVVTPFEQVLLVGLVFVIMFGLGAGLTPRDFKLALRRPSAIPRRKLRCKANQLPLGNFWYLLEIRMFLRSRYRGLRIDG